MNDLYILHNIKKITNIINELQPKHVPMLMAVSKKQPIQSIIIAYESGIHHFGENYLQEALLKIEALKHLPITWHYIGHIQQNKCDKIAQHFDWVQTVDRLIIAEKLNTMAIKYNKKINVCIQINIDNAPTKAGIPPDALLSFIHSVQPYSHLNLRGLMCMPNQYDKETTRSYFNQLNTLLNATNQQANIHMDTLSMGISNDYIEAIKAHSTLIRIGEGIFGKRP